MNKINYFNKEYTYIKDDNIVKDLKHLVNLLPDYFFEIPASSTGKYHPRYAITEHGLIKHTKAAVKIAHELLEDPSIGDQFTTIEHDLIIFSLILHDGLKLGNHESKYTKTDHPLLASNFIKENSKDLTMTEENITKVCQMIESHMGPWNKDYYTKKEVLPKPQSDLQIFVHMCDYLASRKFIEIPFEGIEIKD